MDSDDLYIAGANTIEGFTYKDLNGDFWRYKYDANLNYPISNLEDLGSQFHMFSVNGSNPQLIIIGKDSKLVFSYFGYITEQEIRDAIESAVKEFGDLHQVEKLGSVFMDVNEKTIDLDQKFISVTGDNITYELISKNLKNVADAQISGSDLILTKGTNTGIEKVFVRAATTEENVTDSFSVMAYPSGTNIIAFEEDENWENYFYYLGDEVWNADTTEAFTGLGSFRSGYIPAPEAEGEVKWTMVRADFFTDKDDTLAFAYKVSSQYGSDGFELCIDDEWLLLPEDRWTGEVDWALAEYPVKAGNHFVDWDYYKLEYGYAGRDAAWIDIVRIPGIVSGIETAEVPERYGMISNYPNPFNSITVLKFRLRSDASPVLTVYNIKGETVIEKHIGKMKKGINSYGISFDGFESGSYLYTLKTDDQVLKGKFLYLK